jgi:hypothetical protein
MRYLKMLGLAAVIAASLTAFVGASSASAAGGVLCKEAPVSEVCPAGKKLAVGDSLSGTLSSAVAKLKAGFAVIECKKSTVGGKVTFAGTATESVEAQIEEETFTECNATVTVNSKGKLTGHWSVATGGLTLTVSTGNSVTVTIGSTSCTYGATVAEKKVGFMGGTPATADATEANTELVKTAGGALCASPAKWIAEYKITSPATLFGAAS